MMAKRQTVYWEQEPEKTDDYPLQPPKDPTEGDSSVVQGLLVGKPFNRRLDVNSPDYGKEANLKQGRRVEVTQGFDPNTGRIVFSKDVPEHQFAQDFPTAGLDGPTYDRAEVEGADLTTIRKRGASKRHQPLKR